MCYFSIPHSPQLSTSCRDWIFVFFICLFRKKLSTKVCVQFFWLILLNKAKKGENLSPIMSIMVRMEWYDGSEEQLPATHSPHSHHICSSLYFALPGILLCSVFCSSLYFAHLCILLCSVFCSSLYFALFCILLCSVFCPSLYFALPGILLFPVICSSLYFALPFAFALLCIMLFPIFKSAL